MPYKDLFHPIAHFYVGCDMYPANSDVVACPADELAFADGQFDVVVCFQVLEHVPRPGVVLRECARVLKTGGVAVVTVPFLFPYHGAPRDYFRYTPDGMAALAESAGMKIAMTDPQVPLIATMFMLLNIQILEVTGVAQRIPGIRLLIGFLNGLFFSASNSLGLACGFFDSTQRGKNFPGYANYAFVLRKLEPGPEDLGSADGKPE